MSKKVLVPLARGFEEIEFVSIVDVLRRARLEVITACLDDEPLVRGAHGIEIRADSKLSALKVGEFEAIALAGGYEGMLNLKASKLVLEALRELHSQKKLVAAICASPIVLDAAGVLSGKFSAYPGCEQGLNGSYVKSAVVCEGKLITAAGPAVAVLFALELVRALCDDKLYESLKGELLVDLLQSS